MSTKKQSRLKAAILDWLGVPVGLTDVAFWSALSSGTAGQTVNQSTVMQLSAAWACIRLIAETISTLPFGVYQRVGAGKKSAFDHPLHNIIHTTSNGQIPACVYWESCVSAMLTYGNAFSEMLMIGNRLVGLDFLPNSRLKITRTNGGLRYQFTDASGNQKDIPENRIFRIPGFTLDSQWGVSSIEYGCKVFGSALAGAQAANSMFENGLMPTTYFKMDKVLRKDQREEFRENLQEVTGAMNGGKSPLLEGGMDIGVLGFNPKDAQLLESRGFSVEEICRWFRVPPHMVGHSEKVTSWGTGIEQQNMGFVTYVLLPWLIRIESYVNLKLLSPADRSRFYTKHSIEGLLRADSQGRAVYYREMKNVAAITSDEIRELEDLEPIGGNAAKLTINSSSVLLDDLGRNEDETVDA